MREDQDFHLPLPTLPDFHLLHVAGRAASMPAVQACRSNANSHQLTLAVALSERHGQFPVRRKGGFGIGARIAIGKCLSFLVPAFR
jgi:hypothetical protein